MDTEVALPKEVTVNVYGNKLVPRMAVRDLGDVVLVCKIEEFASASLEKRDPVTIGIKKKDIDGL